MIGFSCLRVETHRWVAFRSHFDVDAFYCQPGVAGAHEKGGVEGDIGRFRRNYLVPIPEVDSLQELNELIDDYDRADDNHRTETAPTLSVRPSARKSICSNHFLWSRSRPD